MTFLKNCYPRTTIVIDGDLYLYRCAASCEEETDWGDDVWSLSTDLKQAKAAFAATVFDFAKDLDAKDIVVTLSGHNNFRKSVEPSYKAARKKTRKPVGYKALTEWVKETYETIQVDCLEADDVMGILGSVPQTRAIVVSDDKDMKSVPCRLYRPASEERLHISEAEADRYFYTQTLTGDVTDGYSGCPKIGPKTAEKVLGSHATWNAVVNAYQKENLTADYALTQARLARILRDPDWDEETQAVKLWEPTR
jgi:DNA polymerase-1